MTPPTDLTIPALSDYHVHLRDGGMLAAVAPHSAAHSGRVLAMPNLTPPVRTAADALAYRDRVAPHLGATEFLLALKLMPDTTPADVAAAARLPFVTGWKLYPAGATTHSADGVPAAVLRHPDAHPEFRAVLAAVAAAGQVLHLHGEMPDEDDPLEREPQFLAFVEWVLGEYPGLRVVLEHVTTAESVRFVRLARRSGCAVAATITAHHLLVHLGHLVGSAASPPEQWLGYGDGKLHPHLHCWPMAKRPDDRAALVEAATAGGPGFFLGSDSAPHARHTKEADCGCAGVFSAPVLPEVLAAVFDAAGRLDSLPGFVAHSGDAFFGRPPTGRRLRLVREPLLVPFQYGLGAAAVVPFLAGRTIPWRLQGFVAAG
jgi:dihydroorotase